MNLMNPCKQIMICTMCVCTGRGHRMI